MRDGGAVAYTGGAVVLLLPLGFLGKGKNQVFWFIKRACPHHQRGVSPLKSIVEHFLAASSHLFSKFTVVFLFYLKSPPHCILAIYIMLRRVHRGGSSPRAPLGFIRKGKKSGVG